LNMMTPISGDSDCSACGGIIHDRYEHQLLPSWDPWNRQAQLT
jgi:hypothetical protein